MAANSTNNLKANSHIRSISLPSRSHPIAASVEEELWRLSTNSSSIFQQLSSLKELNECADSLLQLPSTQQALSNDINRELVEGVLDGPLRLLDLCGTTRDAFSQLKESLQELESSIRRRRSGVSRFEAEIQEYMISRKKLNKVITNCFKNIKTVEKKCKSDKASKPVAAVKTLKDAEEFSISVFQSLLSYISLPKTKSNWSVLSKLMKFKRVEDDANELQKMEAELVALMYRKEPSIAQVQNALNGIKAIESSIQEIAEESEFVFRQLLKNRATLLNIITY